MRRWSHTESTRETPWAFETDEGTPTHTTTGTPVSEGSRRSEEQRLDPTLDGPHTGSPYAASPVLPFSSSRPMPVGPSKLRGDATRVASDKHDDGIDEIDDDIFVDL
ncbi:hypothetical protein GOBAR_DD28065 [Gossypium barbadense]|nr:hypothetical protein GOBAR_DD28065 [Gossypium barbadense]